MSQQRRKQQPGSKHPPAALGISSVCRKKKRVWIQPKDKSQARKKFIKVRDARARSEFSKLQKQKKENQEEGTPLHSLAPVASALDNDSFLRRLMDPFAKVESETSGIDDEEEQNEEAATAQHRKKERQKNEGTAAPAADDEGKETAAGRAAANSSSASAIGPASSQQQEEAEGEETSASTAADRRPPVKGKGKQTEQKGYMPFLKARRAFEAMQREKEAARLARAADEKEKKARRQEKKRFDSFKRNKLNARTKKGQLVMGNVVDVLLLKMQKQA